MAKKTMEDYIRLSSSRLKENLDRRKELTGTLIAAYKKSPHKNIRIIASGSSYNSCTAVLPFLKQLFHTHAEVVSPYTYEHYILPAEDAFCFAVSQSGCSTNILSALEQRRKLTYPCIALTGNPEADIRETADLLIEYGAGNETVDFVTLGVVTLMEFLLLFALEGAYELGLISPEEYHHWDTQLQRLPKLHQQTLAQAEQFCETHAKEMYSFQPVFLCGAGPNYGTALEGALKFQETLKVPAMAYEPEEFIHGPNMQMTPNYSVFLIDSFHKDSRVQDIYRACLEITDRAYLISGKKDPQDSNLISIPDDTDELLSPVYIVSIFQYITAHMTELLHCWDTHPLFARFEKKVRCKTDDYEERMKQKELQDRMEREVNS